MEKRKKRAMYNGYYVPIQYLSQGSWPPTYIGCDCGQLAKHIVYFKLLPGGAPHFIQTFTWKCEECGACYRQLKGTFDVERMEETEGKADEERGKKD